MGPKTDFWDKAGQGETLVKKNEQNCFFYWSKKLTPVLIFTELLPKLIMNKRALLTEPLVHPYIDLFITQLYYTGNISFESLPWHAACYLLFWWFDKDRWVTMRIDEDRWVTMRIDEGSSSKHPLVFVFLNMQLEDQSRSELAREPSWSSFLD